MEIIEGKIVGWEQARSVGQNQNWAQVITIEGRSGAQKVGEMLVKEKNIFNKLTGDEQYIKWEATPSEYPPGLKLKKHRDTPYQGGQQSGKPEPDWDKIARGKVLCNVVCAAIQSEQMSCTSEQVAQDLTDFIMGERTQSAPEPQAATPILDALPDDIPF